jgi:hypothetical protein
MIDRSEQPRDFILHRTYSVTEALWDEAHTLIKPKQGLLVLDDTTLEKPYAKKMELVHYHWSGKHRRVLSGINLLSTVVLWTEGEALVPTATLGSMTSLHYGL